MPAIYTFGGGYDGQSPVSGAVAPKRTAPYPQVFGTTEFGGYNNIGVVYGLTKNRTGWSETLVYQFNGTDGNRPIGIAVPKTLDQTGRVFVTSMDGGAHGKGSVTVLKPNASASWTLLSVYSFKGRPDGWTPQGPVIEDANGNVYGTTSGGGTRGHGIVYRMSPAGSGYRESVLYNFKGGSDGDYPRGGLIALHGALYGTTEDGGANGKGAVFKLTSSGSGYTERIIYSFKGPPADGENPEAGLCATHDGELYGTATQGGYDRGGTIFKLAPRGSKYVERVIWNFGSFYRDGSAPMGPVIVNGQGAIYGTTLNGGASNTGAFFVLTPNGGSFKEALHSFNGGNGASPEAGPGADGNGNLYIATYAGGPHFDGVVALARGDGQPTACDPGSVTIGG